MFIIVLYNRFDAGSFKRGFQQEPIQALRTSRKSSFRNQREEVAESSLHAMVKFKSADINMVIPIDGRLFEKFEGPIKRSPLFFARAPLFEDFYRGGIFQREWSVFSLLKQKPTPYAEDLSNSFSLHVSVCRTACVSMECQVGTTRRWSSCWRPQPCRFYRTHGSWWIPTGDGVADIIWR